jgi:hypothetical protein
VKDLQSKLDAATAECLTEKEKVIDHFFFETVTIIQLLVSHIYITTPWGRSAGIISRLKNTVG